MNQRLLRNAALGAALVVGGVVAAQVQPPVRPPIHPPIRPIPQPAPQVTVAAVDLTARIKDGIASVEVTHVFKNNGPGLGEADFVFPIPAGATVREFALYDGEKRYDAKLLNQDEATRAYEEIVRQRRDPALLTYIGQSALRARVFPIPGGGERRVTLKLTSVLPREGATRKFAWALAGPHLPGGMRPEKVSVRVIAENTSSVYSPTHSLQVNRAADGRLIAEWSSANNAAALVENPELALYLTPHETEPIALTALAYNTALPENTALGGGPRQSGYFMVVASPNISGDIRKLQPPRRVVLVMDRSGSMQGKKLEQARAALTFAVGKLRPQDSFNIITFSEKVEHFAPQLVPASKENLVRAQSFVDDIVADSGTNINDALLAGLKQFPEAGRGNTLLFFTDGLPTVGVKDQTSILQNAVAAAQKKARCFVFGVGYDVDVPFLDKVASKLRGDADYVRPDENIEVKTSQFVAKTNAAVLENLKLSVSGARVADLYPRPDELPDLFDGGQLVLVGRYVGEGQKVEIALSGEVFGKPQRFTLQTTFPALAPEADFLPRLWASRKIGYLLDEIRDEHDPARKKELEEQVIALSREFGVLTPYTALFVPEPGTNFDGSGLTRDRFNSLGGIPGAGGFGGGALKARTGEAAVNLSQSARAGRAQGQAGNAFALQAQSGEDRKRAEAQLQQIQYAANRAFYQRGARWEDGTYDPKKQTDVVKIKLFSDAYFALVRRNANLARWASVGENVLVVANTRQAIVFGDEGKEKLTEKELAALLGK